jgi:hypothetical protein
VSVSLTGEPVAVTLRRERSARKARFRAALALARMTAKEWTIREKVTETHLYAVLKGERRSEKLTSKVDTFISKHLGEVAA